MFLRSDFSSSTLVRLLGDWTPADAQAPAMDFAERLSLWLNAFDAIGLQSAHQAIRAIRTTAGGRPVRAQALQEDVQRVRSALAGVIAKDPLQLAALDAALPADLGYAPYQQRHLELQRQMEQMVRPLRDHVRQALGAASPRLRQLAALDAVLEQVLAPREQLLLPTAATLLERRFGQLRQAHRQALEAAGQPDDPARWREAGGWLAAFDAEWRQALGAEADLRLEPVVGLVEALCNDMKNSQ